MLLPYPRSTHGVRTGQATARSRDYPIIRLLIGALYGMAVLLLAAGVSTGAFLWLRAESISHGVVPRGPLAATLNMLTTDQLYLTAAVAAGGGVVVCVLLAALGQILAMQRDRAINGVLQAQLLEDILELNEQVASTESKVELCEGCGRLACLQKIESGQWVCRECRRQLRTA